MTTGNEEVTGGGGAGVGSGGGGNSGWGWGSGASGENSDWVCPYDCEGGGNDNGTTTISGDVLITYAYAGGDAAAMIMNTDGSGPLTSRRVTPEPTDSGATAPYSITGWVGHGEMNLIGCHDSNYNLLIDAADNCGAYASEPDVDGNPISFAGNENIEGDIQIPLGDVQIDLVPFVTVHGSLETYLGDFSDHASGSVLHVAAMKFRPSSDIVLEDMVARSYDYESWDVADLAGTSAVDYELAVPANTIIYLLAFMDEGGNNVVNEENEAVASGSTDNNGRLATGSRSQEINMQVQPAEWDGETESN